VYGVSDHLFLRTLDGAADLLVEELRALPSIHSIRQTSPVTVACTVAGPLGELAACTLFSTLAIPLPLHPSDRDFLCPLESSRETGVLTTLEPHISFRVGTDDPAIRRTLITAVENRLGWTNRPNAWDVNLTHAPRGWFAEIGPLSWTRRFGRMERLPWSTNLIVAEVLVRLAKLRPGHRILDPFCGTGTILVATRRREPTTHALGLDHDPHALKLATRNNQPGPFALAGAEALPLADRSVDRVVTNLPFGKQVGSHRINCTLYPAALSEIDRVLTTDGRAVLLTEDKRLLLKAIDQQPTLKLVRQRLLKYNGATPTAHILTRPRRPR